MKTKTLTITRTKEKPAKTLYMQYTNYHYIYILYVNNTQHITSKNTDNQTVQNFNTTLARKGTT